VSTFDPLAVKQFDPSDGMGVNSDPTAAGSFPATFINEAKQSTYDLAMEQHKLNDPPFRTAVIDGIGADAQRSRIESAFAAENDYFAQFTGGPAPVEGDYFAQFTDGTVEKPKPLSLSDKRWAAGELGIRDSIDGITDILGGDMTDRDAKQKMFHRWMEEEEAETGGHTIMFSYFAGLGLDPMTYAMPLGKLKQMNTIRKFLTKAPVYGAASAAISGATGYLDPDVDSLVTDGKMGRLEQTGLSAVAGGVIGPVAAGVGKLIQKGYEPIGDAAWKVLSSPVGVGAVAGGTIGYNVDRDAPTEDRLANALMVAAVGGTIARTPKMLEAAKLVQPGARGSTEWFGEMIVPHYKQADEFIWTMNKFRGVKSVYAADWDQLVQGVRDLPPEGRKVLYRMLQNRNMGLDDMDFELAKVGLAADARLKIQDYGRALVDLGLLEDKVFLRNIDDYLSTSYRKHEQGKFSDPIEAIKGATHMFKLRGKVFQSYNRKMWERGDRPDTVGEWELLDDVIKDGATTVRVRRQWTKEEKLGMGEIEDAAFALHKTGQMMSNERALGEMFRELAQSPNVAKTVAGDGLIQIPKQNKLYGDLAGMWVEPRVFRELKKLRGWDDSTLKSKWIDRYKTGNGIWKGLHTIVAPPVHLGNFLSSGSMFDLAGGQWLDFAKAAKNMSSQDKMFKQMQEDGIFGSGFMREINEGNSQSILKMYADDSAGFIRIGDGPDGLSKAMDWTFKVVKKVKAGTWDSAGKLYQLEDNIWRAALYRTKLDDYLRSGLSTREARGKAARDAKEFFVDYDNNTPLLEGLRHTFIPFLSYSYGTIPKLAEVAAKNPVKYAKWAAMFYALNEIGEGTSEEDPATLQAIKKLSQAGNVFGIPGMIKARATLPKFVKDLIAPDSDEPMELNAERMLAGGKLEMGEDKLGNQPWLPGFLQASGGLAGAVGYPILGGLNQFSGTKVAEGERMETALRNVAPNWSILPGTYANIKKRRAESGEQSSKKDINSPTQATLQGLGVRVQSITPSKQARRIAGPYKRRLRELAGKIKKVKEESAYSDSEKERRLNKLFADKRKIQQAMHRALEGE
jgi:hypothetical protein